MSREFSVGTDQGTLINGAATLVLINNTSAGPGPSLDVMRMWTSQQGNTTSTQAMVEAVTQNSPYGTNYQSVTPRALKIWDNTASVITGNTNGTAGTCAAFSSFQTEGAGTRIVRWGDNFNILNGYLWVATPREVVSVPTGSNATAGFFGLFLPASLTARTNWAAGLNYSEGTP